MVGLKMNHPNVMRIYDIVVENDTLGLVMDLVEGRPLEDIIPAGGMSFDKALPIISSLCDALDTMHKQGIIHRDLKPENIIIRPDGSPVILDMGIAKITGDGNLSATRTGMRMGTPLYMAPEQGDAKNVTSGADRYAFALIFFPYIVVTF